LSDGAVLSCRASRNAARRRKPRRGGPLATHPDFLDVPAPTPLTYTLTMKASLSIKPEDRPEFSQLLVLLADVRAEVAAGQYLDSQGRVQVRCFFQVHAVSCAVALAKKFVRREC
jgi:hypothetical protein